MDDKYITLKVNCVALAKKFKSEEKKTFITYIICNFMTKQTHQIINVMLLKKYSVLTNTVSQINKLINFRVCKLTNITFMS